ncbi:CocE/NonD family hydrolase [Xanthomonas campestris]|nr:CocE/NonD family hydrolase [Xanthomonas campestris]MDC8748452.1 CocE/NonD family hydrolase [Xanthomonas campestris]
MRRFASCLLATAITAATGIATAQMAAIRPAANSAPPEAASSAANDYIKREVMIPMRDGVKLHTIIVLPKGAHHAPMLLTRTPFGANRRTQRAISPHMKDMLVQGDDVFVEGGYIRVMQDIRGKGSSEGDYVMNRPLRGPLNSSEVDHATDAWDTIDWLVKNVNESNGKVGLIGSSYEGFTVTMALTNPHPALKVAAPESPMIDTWMGDDWFNYGAFRQVMFGFMGFIFAPPGSNAGPGSAPPPAAGAPDDYSIYLAAGSANDYAKSAGLDKYPLWGKITEHPAYDSFWQGQALDQVMARTPLKVPTMWVQGLWDQEDMWGAIHSYAAMEPRDRSNTLNYLVMGPWRHSQANYDGSALGELRFKGDTARQFRADILRPFFDQYLVDGAPKAATPPVFIYNTGENHWDRLQTWPRSCDKGCASTSKPLYLQAGGKLSLQKPSAGQPDFEEYVSDPATPVPFAPRPFRFDDRDQWGAWLVQDQRFIKGRPDVLTFVTEPLSQPLQIAGAPLVHLTASTSGSDSDWVVKLIDVYPDQVTTNPKMDGYELPVSLAIFRGRYRESFSTPKALAPNQPLTYRFGLPTANHTFQPGHRVMVQVQSSLFPLYDRNPQTFVPNIFFARPEDYRKATQRIYVAPGNASYIDLPVR